MSFLGKLLKLPGFFKASCKEELQALQTEASLEITLLGFPLVESFIWKIIVLPIVFFPIVSIFWGVFIEKKALSLSLISLDGHDAPEFFHVCLLIFAAFVYAFLRNAFFKLQKKKIFLDKSRICFSSSFPNSSYEMSTADVECICVRKSFDGVEKFFYTISIRLKKGGIVHLFSIFDLKSREFVLDTAHSIGKLVAKDVIDLDC